ncbi:MAG: hypothetical protein M3033_01415 [Acidobacteriota bacterium]|nr:hypothetical protein [Acidobacteriota bacterium]
MSINNSKPDEENDLQARDDSYKSDAGAINAAGIGGTTTASETFDRVGTAASEFNDSAASPLDRNIGNLPNSLDAELTNDDSPMKWIVPLIILFLLIILGYSLCSKPSATTTEKTDAFNAERAWIA